MKNIRFFLSENVHFFVMKFSVYFNRRVFVMLDFFTSIEHRSRMTQTDSFEFHFCITCL